MGEMAEPERTLCKSFVGPDISVACGNCGHEHSIDNILNDLTHRVTVLESQHRGEYLQHLSGRLRRRRDQHDGQ